MLITIGAVMFIGLGLGVAILAWTRGEPRLQLESLPGAMALGGFFALPGGLAVVALWRNDPQVLWPAVVTGLLPALVTILSIGLIFVIPVLLFVQAALRWPIPQANRSWRRRLTPLGIPVLAVLAGLAFFAHRDPACWDYTENTQGRVSYTSTTAHVGVPSGWFVGGGPITGVAVDSNDGIGNGNGAVCVSDRIIPLEAAIGLGLIGGAVLLAVRPGEHRQTPSIDRRRET